jgi:hypothetical protein
MGTNHQINANDVEWNRDVDELRALEYSKRPVGQHILVSRRVGDVIRRADISPSPNLWPETSKVVLLYRPKGQFELLRPGALKPGMSLRACVGNATAGDSLTQSCVSTSAVAVHRGVSEGDSSWIALTVAAEKVSDLARFVSSERRFLLVAR